MNKEKILEIARMCGYEQGCGQCEDFAYFNLEQFANIVADATREECARVCDNVSMGIIDWPPGSNVANECAEAIRLLNKGAE